HPRRHRQYQQTPLLIFKPAGRPDLTPRVPANELLERSVEAGRATQTTLYVGDAQYVFAPRQPGLVAARIAINIRWVQKPDQRVPKGHRHFNARNMRRP